MKNEKGFMGMASLLNGNGKRVLTSAGFLLVDMVGPGHMIGAKVFKSKGGAQRKANDLTLSFLKTWVEEVL